VSAVDPRPELSPRRRPLPRRPAAIAACLAVIACSGAIADPPPAVATVNRCATDGDCAGYGSGTCEAATCAVNVGFDYTLVVSGAAGTDIPGYSVLLRARDIDPRRAAARCGTNLRCGAIPGLSLISGSLGADEATQRQVSRSLHGAAGATVSVPTQVEYRPLVPPRPGDDPTATVLASEVGLPLPSVFGRPISGDAFPSASGKPWGGPGATEAIGWAVSLVSGSSYMRYVMPDPPFDDAYPPVAIRVNIPQSQFVDDDYAYRPVDLSAPQTFDVGSDGASLAGWTVALYDRQSQRRISSIKTLADLPATVVLYTSLVDPATKMELVVAPPRGTIAPELGFPAAPTIPRAQTYPRVGPARHVSGRVLAAPGGDAVPAQLTFRSTEPLTSSIQNSPVRYRATAWADASGDFAIDLFQGVYEVAVAPAGETPYAATLIPRFEVSEDDVQGGKSVSVPLKPSIHGAAAVSDAARSPLAEAVVVASPVPGAFDPDHPLAVLARGAQTTTAADGSFTLPVDPGTYDVWIQPRTGSRFPWVVRTSLPDSKAPIVVSAGHLDVGTIVVPLPVDEGRTLFDSEGRLLQGALIRAFYTVAGRKSPFLIGEAMTDANGKYELYLTPPQP